MENEEQNKRQSSGWQVGIPVLQIIFIPALFIFALNIIWNGGGDSLKGIIFMFYALTVFCSFNLLSKSQRGTGKHYSVAAFFVTMIIPVFLLYIYFIR